MTCSQQLQWNFDFCRCSTHEISGSPGLLQAAATFSAMVASRAAESAADVRGGHTH